MINIIDLSYTYPQRTQPALNQVSLQVETGEFILLAGPSGSGKSTLLRCLNGLIPHLSGGTISGQVRVNGLDTVAAGPQQLSHHVGFVFQNPEAQAVLDRVEPEIAFGLENSPDFQNQGRRESKEAKSRRRQAMQARVASVISLLDLEPLRDRPIRTLSGGERQKVALASALVLQPSLLVLDEPTSQLDPQAAADLLAALVRLNQEHGYTIMLAEHRLERILPFISRVLFLDEGRITLDDTPNRAVPQLPYVPAAADMKIKASVIKQKAPAAEKAVLVVDGLSFAYGEKPVLQEVSLAVGAGELVALLGKNGAGKSTLLRCVVGLLTAATGTIRVNGRSTHQRSVADICREVAYLPQNPDDLLFANSVAEELAITLKNHDMETERAAAASLLAQLGLAAVQDLYPRDLSVGQRQRVALGAVIVTEPALILLDEPTRGLDYGAKAALVEIWRQLLAQGKGILLVTHDVTLVAQVAQRVVYLEAGRVLAPEDEMNTH